MEIKNIKKVYCIGIKGAGMTALAQILKNRNIEVAGSDTAEIFYTDEILKHENIKYIEGFAAENVPTRVDMVIHSTAYNVENNVEMAQAKKENIPMLSYPEFLGLLFLEKMGIAVCGTHGKTTTSAMLAEALKNAQIDPSAIVGSNVIAWQRSALTGQGEYFVAEADEYQNKLKYYQPWSAILTSVDWDHPDFFPTFKEYKEVFEKFVIKIPKTGFLVVWGDSADTLEVAQKATSKILTYGFGEDNIYKILNLKSKNLNQNSAQSFEIEFEGQNLGEFETPLSGKHNVLNAASVIVLTHQMQLDLEKIKEALKNFKGTTRRFEEVGKFKDAIIIDDYAHHPDEIKATLEGASERFADKRIWTVFHPHTFSRTKALMQDFAQSFDDSEHVVVIDTYGSAREQSNEATSEELVRLINKYQYGKAEYVSTIDEAVKYFKTKAGQYDVLITMGAGDVWRVAEALKDEK